ncbi:magnesium transporter CorA family protein [bacterium]|nr:magnesium transporter CorA family protein [bacterium]
MLSIYYRTIKDKGLQRLPEVRVGAWVNVVSPQHEEIQFLTKIGISPDQIEDALDPDELPRIEKEDGNIYIIFNVPLRDNKRGLFSVPLSVIITPDIFVTLSKEKLDCVENTLVEESTYTTQKTKNLLRLCLKITESYEREIRRINKSIYAKRINLLRLHNKDIVNLVVLEEALNKFTTSIVALVGIFEKISSGKYVKIFERDQELTEDLIVDSRESLNMCQASIKNISNIRQAYSTVLTNELNKVMKFLTSLTIIVSIPTLITGIYGMNVALPLQKNAFAFVYISLITLFTSLVLVLIFYFKKWL